MSAPATAAVPREIHRPVHSSDAKSGIASPCTSLVKMPQLIETGALLTGFDRVGGGASDVAVVTHIDSDHISGMLKLL